MWRDGFLALPSLPSFLTSFPSCLWSLFCFLQNFFSFIFQLDCWVFWMFYFCCHIYNSKCIFWFSVPFVFHGWIFFPLRMLIECLYLMFFCSLHYLSFLWVVFNLFSLFSHWRLSSNVWRALTVYSHLRRGLQKADWKVLDLVQHCPIA